MVPDAAPGRDMVYFSEVVGSQLVPEGSGFGTFQSTTAANASGALSGLGGSWKDDQDISAGPVVELQPGAVMSFPRWGVRIQCEKVTDM